ncbi:helix-turn-helix transcriptional regulator [Breoghania sp.]|uniref:helix-turn-helix domain-containing protein n=1 Tax=Breoghania sp. TaxID=2065378 RepID=UPI002AAA6EA4|nr:helix-turn-helix transcriptional regulator [Breoghania sp.]
MADKLLTEREAEVLTWAAHGKTSREISDILKISANTVNFHIKNVLFKLGAVNRSSAVVAAIMAGEIDVTPQWCLPIARQPVGMERLALAEA